jgi:hypothetical protein
MLRVFSFLNNISFIFLGFSVLYYMVILVVFLRDRYLLSKNKILQPNYHLNIMQVKIIFLVDIICLSWLITLL